MSLEDTLAAVGARAFPERHDLGITGLTEINEGWECEVYAFTVTGIEDGTSRADELILRVYQGRQGAAKCENECTALAALLGVGFPVPALLYEEEAPGIDGRPFAIVERIPGRLLGDLLGDVAPEEREALVQRFCRLLADLHALEWRSLVPNPSALDGRNGIERFLEMGRQITAHYGITEFDPVLAWLEDRRAAIALGSPSLTHGDYHPWNVLCPSPDKLVVIDWTNAEIQDYRFDLAWTLLLASSTVGPSFRDRILAEYETARGAPVEDLPYFEAIAATRRLGDIYISVRYGAEAMGMRPGAEALMSGENRHAQAAHQLLRERTGLSVPAFAGGV
jgi:aminoglycoside phosphotransferase (APT) family kinase protein